MTENHDQHNIIGGTSSYSIPDRALIQRLSQKALSSSPSLTLEAKRLTKERIKKGLDVFDFGLGETKGALPSYIKDGGIQAIEEELTGYIDPGGLPELRQEIIRWLDLEEHYNEDNVLVSVGAKQALFTLFLTICNPGDIVLLDRAPWVSYAPMIQACSAVPITVEPQDWDQNGFKISEEDLRRMIASYPQAKALLVNSPCNPTGQVYSEEELNSLLSICAEHGIFFILDRLYWKTIFDGKTFPEPKITPENRPWLIQLDGLSKNWRACGGLRVGWTVTPADINKAMINIQSHTTSGTATPGQWAALAALRHPYDSEMRDDLQEKKDLFQKLSKELPFIKTFDSDGGFYCFWDVREILGTQTPKGDPITGSNELVRYLIEEAGVITLSGAAFQLDGYIRTCFHQDKEIIEKGLKEAARAIKELR